MYSLRFYNDAKLDYINIGKYIAQDNLYYANEVLGKIDSSIDKIIMFPFLGEEIVSSTGKTGHYSLHKKSAIVSSC